MGFRKIARLLSAGELRAKILANTDREIGPAGCWEWTGAIASGRYGWVVVGPRCKGSSAHRVAYETYVGPIQDGLQIDHLCKNTRCCNPDHLEAVTARENVIRSTNLAALNSRKTHCKRRHPLSGSNLYVNPRGERQCRICQRAREKRSYAKRKARPA